MEAVMTESELAKIFSERYHNARKGNAVTAIHLFGIEFSEFLAGQSLPSICALAGVPASFKTELRKGIRLAEFVSLK
tara:strand:+ start:240 stop:470 length:231 start_codon:yes stop_codon:yes gene_type:complete